MVDIFQQTIPDQAVYKMVGGQHAFLYTVDGSAIQQGEYFDFAPGYTEDLSNKNLSGLFMPGVDLTNSILSDADLTGADLTGAVLTGANLSGANLSGANLRDADLTGIDFTSTNLTGSILDGANLTNATLPSNDIVLKAGESFGIEQGPPQENTLPDTHICVPGDTWGSPLVAPKLVYLQPQPSVNNPPALTDVKASLIQGTEDLEYIISTSDLLQGYEDVDGDTLSIVGLSATNGVINSNGDETYTFTPNPDFNGDVTLSYVVTDGNGGNIFASNTFNIAAVNDNPIRTGGNIAGTLFMVEDQAITSLDLSGVTYSPGGGSDEDNQTLTYTIVSVPKSSIGTVYLYDNVTPVSSSDTLTLSELQGLKFLPAPNANGQTIVEFTVTDSENNSITETLNINIILGFNDNPNVVPITLPDGFENTPYTFTKSDLLAGVTDPDIIYNEDGSIKNNPHGDVLTVTELSATNGTLVDNGDETYTFTPNPNFTGVVNINGKISDGQGGSTDIITINLTIKVYIAWGRIT